MQKQKMKEREIPSFELDSIDLADHPKMITRRQQRQSGIWSLLFLLVILTVSALAALGYWQWQIMKHDMTQLTQNIDQHNKVLSQVQNDVKESKGNYLDFNSRINEAVQIQMIESGEQWSAGLRNLSLRLDNLAPTSNSTQASPNASESTTSQSDSLLARQQHLETQAQQCLNELNQIKPQINTLNQQVIKMDASLKSAHEQIKRLTQNIEKTESALQATNPNSAVVSELATLRRQMALESINKDTSDMDNLRAEMNQKIESIRQMLPKNTHSNFFPKSADSDNNE